MHSRLKGQRWRISVWNIKLVNIQFWPEQFCLFHVFDLSSVDQVFENIFPTRLFFTKIQNSVSVLWFSLLIDGIMRMLVTACLFINGTIWGGGLVRIWGKGSLMKELMNVHASFIQNMREFNTGTSERAAWYFVPHVRSYTLQVNIVFEALLTWTALALWVKFRACNTIGLLSFWRIIEIRGLCRRFLFQF